MVLWSELKLKDFLERKMLLKMGAENCQITSNLNINNSQTNYLYMELLHVDDSNEVFSGFRIV